MSKNRLQLKIITPAEIKVDAPVDMVVMRAVSGDMGVLPGHEPRSAALSFGVLRFYDGDDNNNLSHLPTINA